MIDKRDFSTFSLADFQHMDVALAEAGMALAAGDYPVGAVLTIDGEVAGAGRNALYTAGRSSAHAEHQLLDALSPRLRQAIWQTPPPFICLYTTLEPCLMCLGITILHRVNRVVIACPDPHGGATGLNVDDVGTFYSGHWPDIHFMTGAPRRKSWELIMSFLQLGKFKSSKEMIDVFEQMRARWLDG